MSPMRPLTRALVLKQIRQEFRLTAWVNPFNEIQIDYRRGDPRRRGGTYNTAYYTNDPHDARATACAMAEVRP